MPLNADHRMDHDEISRLLELLSKQTWVKKASYPGVKVANSISIECHDGKFWRIAQPIHYVRLKRQYDGWKGESHD